MNNTKKSLKSSNGITLIALVITIIILLILAGISISMLSGDNSILQKATTAKENTERASVIEQAKTEVLGQIAENKGETITVKQLKAILSKYFEEFDDELPENLSETTITLTAREQYGGYTNIALSDIYNGNLSNSQSSTHSYHILQDTPAEGITILSVYDENDNQFFLTSQNQARIISGSGVYIDEYTSDGCLIISLEDPYARFREVTVGITIGGKEWVTETVVYPCN